MIKQVAKFDKDDIKKLRDFFAVLTSKNITYDLGGDTVETVGQMFGWYRGLEAKIDGALKRQMLEEIDKKKPRIGPIDKNKKRGKK